MEFHKYRGAVKSRQQLFVLNLFLFRSFRLRGVNCGTSFLGSALSYLWGT